LRDFGDALWTSESGPSPGRRRVSDQLEYFSDGGHLLQVVTTRTVHRYGQHRQGQLKISDGSFLARVQDPVLGGVVGLAIRNSVTDSTP
jgi:septal ring factor EnvC (AmiA/AmiB activator)